MIVDLEKLRQPEALLKEMSRGTHITETKIELFSDLESNTQEYTEIFKLFGHQLTQDPRGFYYFSVTDSSQALTSTSQTFLLIIVCIVDYYANKGMNPLQVFEEGEFSSHEFSEIIGHFSNILDQKGIESVEQLENQFNQLYRYGFAEKKENGRYRFLAPTHRFLDCVLEINQGIAQGGIPDEH